MTPMKIELVFEELFGEFRVFYSGWVVFHDNMIDGYFLKFYQDAKKNQIN